MIIKYDPVFLQKLKKANVRIKNKFKKQLAIFIKEPFSPQLNNHPLEREYKGYRSIDITNDWRAIYTEKVKDHDITAYFESLGTHDKLFRKSSEIHS